MSSPTLLRPANPADLAAVNAVIERAMMTWKLPERVADAADDQPTADLLTQRMEVHEKDAWMLRALLEDGGAVAVTAKAVRRRGK